MKFGISSRQPEEYLNKADELFIDWKDNELIYELYHIAPKVIIMRVLDNVELYKEDWEKLIEYHNALEDKFKIAFYSLKYGMTAKELGIPYYFEKPVNDFPTLNEWITDYNVCEIIPGPTLAHYMDTLQSKKIPIRMIVNSHMMPQSTSVAGAWVRPEDLWSIYNKYVTYIQFDTPGHPTRDNLIREQALFRIYAEQKTWSGDINMLFTNLNHSGVNRLIIDGFGEHRANCRQICEVNNSCHYCYRALDIANPELLKRAQNQ